MNASRHRPARAHSGRPRPLAIIRLAIIRLAVARLAVARLAVARLAVARLAVARLAVARLGLLLLVGTALAGLIATSARAAEAPAAQAAPASIDDIQRQTAEVRGLPLVSPVPTTALDRGALQAQLTRELESDLVIREFRTSQLLLETLGLIPPGFDLRLFQINLLREQIGGLYQRDQRRLYLIADDGPLRGMDKVIIAHEMTHALQDQSFDLKKLLPANGVGDDGLMAATSLLEGDAMLTMREWGRRFLTPDEKRSMDEPRPESPALVAAPLIIRQELEFPYVEGFYFAAQLHQDGGYEAIDRALRDPPRSTEQIIHPDKYLAREGPRSVTLPPLAGIIDGDWRLLRADTLGELVLRTLIQQPLGWPEAETAAEGWGGDAYAILQDDTGARLVVIETAWDTEADAAEFYNAYVRAAAERFGASLRQVASQPSRIRWSVPGMQIQLLKTDDHVRLVFAPDGATLDAVDAQFVGGSQPAPASVPAPGPAPSPAPAPVPQPAPAAAPTRSSIPAFAPDASAAPAPTPDAPAAPTATPEQRPPPNEDAPSGD